MAVECVLDLVEQLGGDLPAHDGTPWLGTAENIDQSRPRGGARANGRREAAGRPAGLENRDSRLHMSPAYRFEGRPMPIYEYECQKCGKVFETIRKFSDPRLTECLCEEKGPVTKLISAPPFISREAAGMRPTSATRARPRIRTRTRREAKTRMAAAARRASPTAPRTLRRRGPSLRRRRTSPVRTRSPPPSPRSPPPAEEGSSRASPTPASPEGRPATAASLPESRASGAPAG